MTKLAEHLSSGSRCPLNPSSWRSAPFIRAAVLGPRGHSSKNLDVNALLQFRSFVSWLPQAVNLAHFA
jgi:hypothetical protein